MQAESLKPADIVAEEATSQPGYLAVPTQVSLTISSLCMPNIARSSLEIHPHVCSARPYFLS